MKKLLMLFLISLSISICTYGQESANSTHANLNWQQNFKTAQKLAKLEEKPLLLFFTGSDWCGPCKMLVTDFFESDKFSELATKEFILYEADFPRNKDLVTKSQRTDNTLLKQKYKVTSFPTLLIVNFKGKKLGKKKGYNLMRETSYHFDFLESILKNIK